MRLPAGCLDHFFKAGARTCLQHGQQALRLAVLAWRA